MSHHSHAAQAAAYLQAALCHIEKAREGDEDCRQLAVAATNAEQALMWLDFASAVSRGLDGHGSVFARAYPMPDIVSADTLDELTEGEREGFIGTDHAQEV